VRFWWLSEERLLRVMLARFEAGVRPGTIAELAEEAHASVPATGTRMDRLLAQGLVVRRQVVVGAYQATGWALTPAAIARLEGR
jgi:DNA-binding Lrp family transcriptional regulator